MTAHTTFSALQRLHRATQRHERLFQRRQGGDRSYRTLERLKRAAHERMAAELAGEARLQREGQG